MTDADVRLWLRNNGLMVGQPPDFVEALIAAGDVRRLSPGESIQRTGEADAGCWGLAAGQAAFFPGLNSPGAPQGSIAWPGDWTGFAPVVGEARLGDYVARTPVTLLWVPLPRVRALLAQRPEWWQQIAFIILHWARRAVSTMGDLQTRDSRARMAGVMLSVADQRRQGEHVRTLLLSQAECGLMANLSRHPAAGILADFAATGLVTLSYRKVTLNNPAGLRRVADEDEGA